MASTDQRADRQDQQQRPEDQKGQVKPDVPGEEAEKPTQIPPKGWLQVVKRGWKESKKDQVPLLSAGLAYYGFMSLFPGLVALVLLYGLFANPGTIANQMSGLLKPLPAQARDLVIAQLQTASQRSTGVTIGVIIAMLLALWSASGGVGNLLTAISTAYDEEEERGFIKKRLLALGITLGVIVFMVIMLVLIAAAPALLRNVFGHGILRWLFEVVRWIVMIILVSAGLAILYRLGPDRDAPKMRWVSVGALAATVLWLIASIGFSLYAANFANYAKNYGALASIVVLLFWLWITAYAILLGAEINAEAEQQTVKDTTKGPPEPLGERGAVVADTVPDDDKPDQKGHDDKADRDKADRDKRDQQDKETARK